MSVSHRFPVKPTNESSMNCSRYELNIAKKCLLTLCHTWLTEAAIVSIAIRFAVTVVRTNTRWADF